MRILRLSAFVLLALLFFLAPAPVLAQGTGGCPGPATYRVRAGDSLSLIAQRFGTDVATLAALNGLTNPDHIEVGQVLRLPCSARVGDRALAALAAGMAVGARLPRGRAALPHLALWQARAATLRRWRTMGVPADLLWMPPSVVPGDVLVVRLVPRHREAITAAVRVLDTWHPLVAQAGGVSALVPLHGFVQPGMLRVTLAIRSRGQTTRTLELPVRVRDAGFPSQKIVLPPSKAGLLAPAVLQAEAARLAKVWAQSAGPPRWRGPFSWPVDVRRWPTTAPYGVRRTYNGGAVRGYHTGQDIAAPQGTPVRAPAAGVVLLAGPLHVRGNAVVIDHGAGVTSNYWHLSAIVVRPGQTVRRGDLIGYVGTTGLSTGAHLHWEIRVYGVPVNPVPWTKSPGPATWWR